MLFIFLGFHHIVHAQDSVDPVKVSVAESEISRLLYQQIMSFNLGEKTHWLEFGRGVIEKDAIAKNLFEFKDLIRAIIEHNSGQPDIRTDPLPEPIKNQLLILKEQLYLAVDLLSEKTQSKFRVQTKLFLDQFYTTLATKPSPLTGVGYSHLREPAKSLSSNIAEMIKHYHEPTTIYYPPSDMYYVELRQWVSCYTLDFLASLIERMGLTRAEIEQVVRDLGNEQGKFKDELFAKLNLKLNFKHRSIHVKKMVINEIRVTLNSIIHIQELSINPFKIEGDYRGKNHENVGERYLRDLTEVPMQGTRLERLQRVMRQVEVW